MAPSVTEPDPNRHDAVGAVQDAARAPQRASLATADVDRIVKRLTGGAPDAAWPLRQAPPLLAALRERWTGWRRRRLGLRGVLLYLLPLPLPLAALVALAGGDFGASLAALTAFAALVAGAYLNRRSLRERLVAPARQFSRSNAAPRAYLAALLVAAGTATVAAGVLGHDTLVSAAFAVLAAVGFHLSYPLPVPRGPTPASRPGQGDGRLAQALELAERRLIAIELAAEGVGNQELEERLRRIALLGRGILQVVADRPTELFRARRFLNVYLEGAERVASRYARTHRLLRAGVLESNFRTVLGDIEAAFERQRTALLEHDVEDLDVQIEVLRKQLQREGIY